MEEEIRNRLADALARAGADVSAAGVELTVPLDAAHGDWSTNAALTAAKTAGVPPRTLATALVEAAAATPGVARAEVAGPGFVNIYLADRVVFDALTAALAQGADYGRSAGGAGAKVQVEFVSANPTGPLNAVSARAAAFGDALARLLAFTGARVDREFYVCDCGSQIEMLGASVRARGMERRGEAATIPEDGYRGEYVVALADRLAAAAGWEKQTDAELGSRAAQLVNDGQRRDLEAFGVRGMNYFPESSLYPRAVEEMLARLAGAGLSYVKEGATWFRTTAGGDDEDRVLVRSDGRPTYFAADVAYHLNKKNRGYGKVIDVLGPDHHGHIKKLLAMARLLGFPEGWLEVIISQQVNLLEGGEKVKMSKRAGALVPMADVVHDIGVDAARFFFLLRAPSSHLDFDLALARKQTLENPVYYAQYCHARVASLVREAGGEPAADDGPAAFGELDEPEERTLARKVWAFPYLVTGAAAAREPHRLTAYAGDTASLFHRYYQHHRILQAPRPAQAAARLTLARAVGQTIKNALELLGVSVPERM